jgi:hypothetical protein
VAYLAACDRCLQAGGYVTAYMQHAHSALLGV